MFLINLWNRIGEALAYRFPDRQIYHRTEGQVRYFVVTTSMQISIIVAIAILSLWLVFNTVSLVIARSELAETIAQPEIGSEPSRPFIITGGSDPSQLASELGPQTIQRRADLEQAISLLEQYTAIAELEVDMLGIQKERLELEVSDLRQRLDAMSGISDLTEEQVSLLVDYVRFEGRFNNIRSRFNSLLFFSLGAIFSIYISIVFRSSKMRTYFRDYSTRAADDDERAQKIKNATVRFKE